ncbi:phosphoribosylformylglycinamidine cyclo-ligase [Neobacillus piezotolerans]|uniref:Phosphoribosylformylglycinamidine cyclo-ligase n=1 Tax=Neobacillus piezotolerans TaxID=2259171 RepID=A0A3D8GJT5_9BACI|nr:phosphoribosylformylglycinamidine cyclo-ligase [Neobacillus piezotolerans]RDU34678.1 phosphoribosylformylglycinamidine cyclo-ligase [Neobacillus piezotolerans]
MSKAYKEAGVNIEAGYEAVEKMKRHVRKTARPGVMGGLGGFGAMFDLSALNLKEPVLISGTDGVGTKLMLAFMTGRHDTIGIDAVAMCVNDIVVQGAEPLYFLDYIGCGKADPDRIEAIVKGVADGCEQAGCALIGGETAEMPGMYEPNEYDLAGFAVGACEKQAVIDGSGIRKGDALVGIASSGLHSNGFTLARKVFFEKAGLEVTDYIEEFGCTLGEELLKPTKIYVKPILSALKQFPIKGMSHITGGGFHENIPRMLPEGLGAVIARGTWEIPPVFSKLEQLGKVGQEEMYHVFNMGIGMVVAINEELAPALVTHLEACGERASVIGHVADGKGIKFS